MKYYIGSITTIFFAIKYGNMLPMEEALILPSSIVLGSLLYLIMINMHLINGKNIGNLFYALNAGNMGSLANNLSSKEGFKWTASHIIKSWSYKKNEKTIYLDNFKFSQKVVNNLSIFGLKQLYDNHRINIPIFSKRQGEGIIEGLLLLGGAGGGKSEFLFNIFAQDDKYNRAIIHDTKQEFIERFYREDKDIIINHFDDRGSVWDLFEEAKHSPSAVELFFDTYIKSFMDKDFWSNASILEYKSLFTSVCQMDADSKTKWGIYVEEISNIMQKFEEGDNKGKQSIALTMKMIQKHFITQDKLIQGGAKTFTIHSFLKQQDIKIFLSNRTDQSTELTPYFTAFVAVLTAILGSKENTKEDFTMLILDEYLSFLKVLDAEVLTTLHTTLRSKGVIVVPAMQYIPKDPELSQIILNSVSYFVIFPITEPHTVETVKKMIGKNEYLSKSVSLNTKGRVAESQQLQTKEDFVINDEILSTMANVPYGHITFAPKINKLYIGYTPQVKTSMINDAFIEFKSRDN